jgi:hypothetical protein
MNSSCAPGGGALNLGGGEVILILGLLFIIAPVGLDFSATIRLSCWASGMNNRPNPQPLVWWALWASFQVGIVFFYYFLGQATTQPETNHESPAWLAGFIPFALSAGIRWLVLPRINTAQPALTIAIIGIAFAEVCCFLGLFIFPAHKRELFVISFIGILQFMPIFAGRFYRTGEPTQ